MRTVLAILLLVVVACGAAPLMFADSTTAIQGSYIVVLNKGLELLDRDSHIVALKNLIAASNDNSEISHTFAIGELIGFSATLSEDLLKKELAHPDVQYIEVDQTVSINAPVPDDEVLATVSQTGATWGLSRTSQQKNPVLTLPYIYNSTAGAGVDVYVIDTGILTTHVDFGNRATFVFNAYEREGEPNEDLNGHGTHCAGTVAGTTYGIAKQANLYAVKVLRADGGGTTAGVIAGINYVTGAKSSTRPSVASMSLGGGKSTTLNAAVQQSIAAGIVYVVAAGNSGADACNYSPASAVGAITVGATDRTDAEAYYSNYGSCLSLYAPGTSITSDWIGSNTAVNTISGTSMATPHVSGVIALQLGAYGNRSPAASKSWVTSVATAGVISSLSPLSPDLLLYAPHA